MWVNDTFRLKFESTQYITKDVLLNRVEHETYVVIQTLLLMVVLTLINDLKEIVHFKYQR